MCTTKFSGCIQQAKTENCKGNIKKCIIIQSIVPFFLMVEIYIFTSSLAIHEHRDEKMSYLWSENINSTNFVLFRN